MAWITPKTDWQARYNEIGDYIGDYFNVSDYNRICNNLSHIKELYLAYNKPDVAFENFDTIAVNDLAYAETFNKIERNMEALIKGFGGLNALIGQMKIYLDNGRTIDYTELNRIESLSLEIYKLLPIEYKAQRQLEFSLGLNNIGEFSTLAREVA